MKSVNPLRICIFAKAMTAHRGGTFLWPFMLVSMQLRELGHKVVIITTAHPDGKTTTVREDGVEVHYLSGTRPEKTDKAYWSRSARLFDELHKAHRFDLVMGRGRSTWGFLHQSRYNQTLPLISHEGTYPSWLHPYKITPNKLTDPLKWAHALADATANRRHAACLMKSNLVIGNSSALADAIAEAFWWDSPPTRCIPYSAPVNGSKRHLSQAMMAEDLPGFPRDWLDQQERFIVYVGRVTRRKGAMDLLRVLHGSKDKGLRLVICGSANKANRKRLTGLASELGVADRLHLAGPVPHEALPDILNRAKAFLFPSTHPESLPKSVMEAMSAGLPILGYRIPAMRSLVREGKDGLLVNPGDLQAMTENLNRLLDDEAMRMSMGRNARAHVRSEFSSERIALMWEDALQTYAGTRMQIAPTFGIAVNGLDA